MPSASPPSSRTTAGGIAAPTVLATSTGAVKVTATQLIQDCKNNTIYKMRRHPSRDVCPNSIESFYSPGQLCVLHDLVASEDPAHSAPPLRDAVFLTLQRLCMPPPHVHEHDVHEFQAPQVQSTEI